MNIEHHTKLYKTLRNICPVHIGGSFALFLYGYDLKRTPKNLDIIVPEKKNEINSTALSKVLRELNPMTNYDTLSSMSDFSFVVMTYHNDHSLPLTTNISHNPEHLEFTDIIYKENSYRVTALKYIIEAKTKYASNRGTSPRRKHLNDLKLLHEQGCPGIDMEALKSFSLYTLH